MAQPRMTDLSDLLTTRKPDPAPDQPAPVPEPRKRTPRKTTTTTETTPADTAQTAAASVPAPPVGTPRYKTLVRKELRITEGQANHLGSTVRALNLARNGRGERITDNTLVRVGIGLLLDRLDDLHGTTEAELYRSLGLTPPD